MWVFDRWSPYSYQNNREKYKDDEEKREFNLKECLWFCMTSLTPQVTASSAPTLNYWNISVLISGLCSCVDGKQAINTEIFIFFFTYVRPETGRTLRRANYTMASEREWVSDNMTFQKTVAYKKGIGYPV